jgi:hypothetical protein
LVPAETDLRLWIHASQQRYLGLMVIRAAELTADHIGRTVRIGTADKTFATGRLVKIRHEQVSDETETQLDLEVGDQRVTVGFNAIGMVELQ